MAAGAERKAGAVLEAPPQHDQVPDAGHRPQGHHIRVPGLTQGLGGRADGSPSSPTARGVHGPRMEGRGPKGRRRCFRLIPTPPHPRKPNSSPFLLLSLPPAPPLKEDSLRDDGCTLRLTLVLKLERASESPEGLVKTRWEEIIVPKTGSSEAL